MAEAAVGESDEEDERLLECPVCMNQLQDQRMLPCQHTFCTGCIEPLVKINKIVCPICRDVCDLKDTGVSGLPKNLILGNMLDKLCSDCLIHRKKVMCAHCEKKVCEKCLTSHERNVQVQLLSLEQDCEKLNPIVTTKIQSLFENLIAINHQTEVQGTQIDYMANQMIETIIYQQERQKATLVSLRNTEARRLNHDIKKLSHHMTVIQNFRTKVKNVWVSKENLEECHNITTQWSQQVETTKTLACTTTDTIIDFDVDEKTLLDSLSHYGKITIQKYKRDLCNSKQNNIEYQSKVEPQMVFGRKGTCPDQFCNPTYVAVSPVTGNIVVCDKGNHRIKVCNRYGEFVSQFGSEGKSDGEFRFDSSVYNGGVAVTNVGIIVIADTENDRLQLITEDGQFMKTLGSSGSDTGQFMSPRGVAVDQSGRIYVCDSGNNRIQIMEQDGTVVRAFDITDSGEPYAASGIAVSSKGDVIVVHSHVTIYTSDGSHKVTLESKKLNSILMEPCCIAVDYEDNIVVSDLAVCQVQVMTQNGEHIHSLGEIGNTPGQFFSPAGLVCTVDGLVVVADFYNNNIQIF